MANTKEENVVIELYRLVKEKRVDSIHMSELLREANVTSRQLSNILNQLVRANFVQKRAEDMIFLTPNGKRLAEELL